jgi:hypothetical protein
LEKLGFGVFDIFETMKRNLQTSSVRPAHCSGTFFSRLLLAGALLLGFYERSAAQPFPAIGHDTTPSMGVFQITVDPAFYPLVNPAGALAAYPGFNTSGGTLTSPLCVDSATTIGRSASHTRPYSFGLGIPLDSPTFDSISGYGAYAAIPAPWASAGVVDEVLTEIESFVLVSVGGSAPQKCPPDPRIPSVPIMWPMVTAGTGAGVSPRSIGIVQQLPSSAPNDFPAQSFFDIFVDVNLPPVPGTESATAFPATGAVLYNDSPLIITNPSLASFPPSVIYIHGETPAVPVKFKTSNPPYWSAGDIFGYLVLAGHGTITNDCTQTPAVQALLNAAFGPIGSPASGMPVEWLRPNNLCPSPGSSYDSAMGTNSGGQTIDYITYTVPGGGALYARNFSIGNLQNPIQPPPYFGTNYYNPSNTVVIMALSVDGQNWSPAQASGPISVTISNTTPNGNPTETFALQLTQLSLTGTSPQFGSFMLRESPTLHSTGQHTIRSDPRGYRISSFFDVFTELSLDGGATWTPANRSIRMQASAPPAAPNSIFVTGQGGTGIVLNWLGSFTPQSAPTVTGPYTDLTPSAISGPVTITPARDQQYFRLRQ